ncbi:MAG: 4-hydroxy-tetrahydrodipicolinate reductase [Candidatus Omnitrophica bacterium]|nr:4-hydroxy-tetrahydrodipicolinate reductase [Candidatus Omnitrophota bacterium]
MINLAVLGCCGKMGKRIIALIEKDKGLKLTVALEMQGHPELNTMIEGVKISDDLNDLKNADVVIDFTPMAEKTELLDAVVRFEKSLVIGTTGLNSEQVQKIERAAARAPIVYSPNMSVGVNLLFKLIREAAAKLKNYNVRIKEAHHIHKKDSPSGTAKKIAEIITDETSSEVKDIEAIREGEIIGDHEVTFESDLDTIVLSHSAKTRDIFAQGSLDAVKWLVNKPAGLYSMQNVLGK